MRVNRWITLNYIFQTYRMLGYTSRKRCVYHEYAIGSLDYLYLSLPGTNLLKMQLLWFVKSASTKNHVWQLTIFNQICFSFAAADYMLSPRWFSIFEGQLDDLLERTQTLITSMRYTQEWWIRLEWHRCYVRQYVIWVHLVLLRSLFTTVQFATNMHIYLFLHTDDFITKYVLQIETAWYVLCELMSSLARFVWLNPELRCLTLQLIIVYKSGVFHWCLPTY